MQTLKNSFLSIFLLLCLVVYSTIFIIDERYVGIVKFLGKISRDDSKDALIYHPGLHFKIPFFNQVVKFDTRLQNLSSSLERIPTKEQKFVYVDYFVKWRITDFESYLLATNNDLALVSTLLGQKVSDALKTQFGQKSIEEVVSEDRANIMKSVTKELERKANNMGIKVIDMRIKQISLPQEVSESVYNRMKTKRHQVANSHRAEGKRQAETIQAEADANSVMILARANKEAKEIQGIADAEATALYNKSFGSNVEFYSFYRSIAAYKEVFTPQDVLVLDSKSEFFNFFDKHK